MALRDIAIVNIERAMRKSSVRPATSVDNANSSRVNDEDRPQISRQSSRAPTTISPDTTPVDTQPQYGEDDIGVTLDYEPQNPDGIPQPITHSGSENGESSNSRRHRSRRRNDTESAEGESDGRRRCGSKECCRFYWHHWFGQFLSGIFTGLIFFVIGVVFIVYFKDLPTYIGVLFILVSLPPCCMSVNRWRFARMQRRNRQRALNRLNAVRRLRGHGSENGAHRGTSLPFPDLPPSYNNLGFVTDDQGLDENPNATDCSASLSTDVTSPPTYDDVVMFKQMLEEEKLQENNTQVRTEVTDVDEAQTISPTSTTVLEETETH